MTQRFSFALLTLLTGSVVWLAPAAKADEWDKETVMTFDKPVEIPGKVLPAGSYVFKLADSQADQDVVQVFTQDQKQLLATVMAIPEYRAKATGNTVVTFEEREAGAPEAVHSWFYPGETTGLEFLYPASEPNAAAVTQETEPAPAAAPAPAPEQQATASEPPADPGAFTVSEAEETIVAQALPAPAAGDTGSQDTEPANLPNTLPQTAGNFMMIPLLGIVLLSSGFAVVRFARQS